MTVKLNDYLYSGDTVLRIIQKYARDLRNEARKTGNEIDMTHSEFLRGMASFLVHNDFLTSQSQRIREFYKYMAKEYPYLAFTFKGRIKSLIRVEEKFNGYIVTNIYDGYVRNGKAPSVQELQAARAGREDMGIGRSARRDACELVRRDAQQQVGQQAADTSGGIAPRGGPLNPFA